MKQVLLRGMVSVRKSPIHGYGVFAEQTFQPGDIIEECYCVQAQRSESCAIELAYGFDGKSLIALGCGSIINHSFTENATVTYHPEFSILTFSAAKLILPGEEILTNYGEEWFKSRNVKAVMSRKYKFKLAVLPWRFCFRFLVCAAVLGLVASLHI